MKQHITETQLTELSASQFEKLTKYVTEKNLLPHFTGSQLVLHPASKYLADCMNIGQMIEFLDDNNKKDLFSKKWWYSICEGDYGCGVDLIDEDMIICDALWKTVKEELEKE